MHLFFFNWILDTGYWILKTTGISRKIRWFPSYTTGLLVSEMTHTTKQRQRLLSLLLLSELRRLRLPTCLRTENLPKPYLIARWVVFLRSCERKPRRWAYRLCKHHSFLQVPRPVAVVDMSKTNSHYRSEPIIVIGAISR